MMAFSIFTGDETTFNGNLWQRNDALQDWSIGRIDGTNRFRFEVRSGDVWGLGVHDDASRERSELDLLTKLPVNGQEIWVAYEVLVEPGPVNTGRFCIIGQLHYTLDPGDAHLSPMLACNIDVGGALRIATRYSTEQPLATNPSENLRYTDLQFKYGEWNAFVFRMKVDPTGADSILQIWRNGAQIIDLYNFPFGYPQQQGPHWKFGIYRGNAPETLAVQYNNVEAGGNSLAHRIGAPYDDNGQALKTIALAYGDTSLLSAEKRALEKIRVRISPT